MKEKVNKHNNDEYDEEFRYEINKHIDEYEDKHNEDKEEINKHTDEYEEEYDKEDEEFIKSKTIIAKQAVQILRISGNDINKFVAKVQRGENITDEESEKAQTDTVASFYMSELLSDDLKDLKGKKDNQKHE